MPLANTGAVLSIRMALQDVILPSRFHMIRRYLAFGPEEIRRIYHVLDHTAEGCTGQGLLSFLQKRFTTGKDLEC